MGLKATVQAAAKAAISVVADMQRTVTLVTVGGSTYNATAGAVTPVEASGSIAVLFVEFEEKLVDGVTILAEDKQGLIAAVDLTTAGLAVPAVNDRVVDGGTSWVVMSVKVDPADALYTLHLRKP